MRIGILAVQGGFEAHAKIFKKLGAKIHYVKKAFNTKDYDGIVLPGGESTTQDKLFKIYGIDKSLKAFCEAEKPVFATCAGVVLLAQYKLLDIEIERNAYGPQVFSFESEINIAALNDKKVPAIFIRAPKIQSISDNVKCLAQLENNPVLIQQNSILAATFHPELTDDLSIHKYYLKLIKQ